jgi:hypothetical protein
VHLPNPPATADGRRRQAVTHIREFCASKRHQHLKPITAPNRQGGVTRPEMDDTLLLTLGNLALTWGEARTAAVLVDGPGALGGCVDGAE